MRVLDLELLVAPEFFTVLVCKIASVGSVRILSLPLNKFNLCLNVWVALGLVLVWMCMCACMIKIHLTTAHIQHYNEQTNRVMVCVCVCVCECVTHKSTTFTTIKYTYTILKWTRERGVKCNKSLFRMLYQVLQIHENVHTRSNRAHWLKVSKKNTWRETRNPHQKRSSMAKLSKLTKHLLQPCRRMPHLLNLCNNSLQDLLQCCYHTAHSFIAQGKACKVFSFLFSFCSMVQ